MEPEKKSHGALIGSIVIIVILVIGGIYMWQQKAQKAEELKQIQSEQNTQTNDGELNNLEQDVNSTDTNVDVDASKIQ